MWLACDARAKWANKNQWSKSYREATPVSFPIFLKSLSLIFIFFHLFINSFFFVSVRVQKKREVEMHRHKSYKSPFLPHYSQKIKLLTFILVR